VPTVLRLVRAAMAAAIVIALTYQLVRSLQHTDLGVVSFFSYFTVLSNVGAAGVLAVLAGRPDLSTDPRFVPVRGAITLYMSITFLVYNALLAPASADVGLTARWVDLVVHVVGPLVVVLDWVVDPPSQRLSARVVTGWLLFPAVYFAYSLIRGPIVDWYPYPFLDPNEHSYLVIAVYAVVILAVFVLVALALHWWAGRRVLRPAQIIP
jgi:hypothetical protein